MQSLIIFTEQPSANTFLLNPYIEMMVGLVFREHWLLFLISVVEEEPKPFNPQHSDWERYLPRKISLIVIGGAFGSWFWISSLSRRQLISEKVEQICATGAHHCSHSCFTQEALLHMNFHKLVDGPFCQQGNEQAIQVCLLIFFPITENHWTLKRVYR